MGRVRNKEQASTQGAALTAEERERLEREGFVRLAGVLDARSLAELHAGWDRAEARGGEAASGSNWGPKDLVEEPAFARCLMEPRVLDALRALLGEDLVLRSMAGRSPPLGHGGQGLHIDWNEPVAPGKHLLVNAFWALDDMDETNGATRAVPGSHLWGRAPRGAEAQPHNVHPKEIRLWARAGDVVVASSHVWHAGARNESGRRRRVVIAQFSRPELARMGGYTVSEATMARLPPEARRFLVCNAGGGEAAVME